MKKVVFIFSLAFLQLLMNAQDIIFTKVGEVYEGKILEITETSVKYKKSNNLDGPVYSIDKSKVTKIKYSNGSTDVFSKESKEESNEKNSTLSNIVYENDSVYMRSKNICGVDIVQFFANSVGFVYERFLDKYNRFSIRIPISIGTNYQNYQTFYENNYRGDFLYSDNINLYRSGKVFGTSIEFNYYPVKFKRVNYYIGPYFEYGVFYYAIAKEYTNYYGYYPHYNSETVPYSNGQHLAGGINNGILWHLNKYIVISTSIGIGIKKDETVSAYDFVETHSKINFALGVKF
jgi:hypothetical protein